MYDEFWAARKDRLVVYYATVSEHSLINTWNNMRS